jgi:hypothetical protein
MIDFSTPILDLDGTPAKNEAGKDTTLGSLAVAALLAVLPEDRTEPAEQRARRGWLAQKIHDAPEPIELTAEQVAQLKALIGKVFGPLAVMRAWALLDPASVPKEA